VIERDPSLAAVLRELGATFQARVMRLHHADPDLCWQDEGEWASDGAIHPIAMDRSDKSRNKLIGRS